MTMMCQGVSSAVFSNTPGCCRSLNNNQSEYDRYGVTFLPSSLHSPTWPDPCEEDQAIYKEVTPLLLPHPWAAAQVCTGEPFPNKFRLCWKHRLHEGFLTPYQLLYRRLGLSPLLQCGGQVALEIVVKNEEEMKPTHCRLFHRKKFS